MPIPEVKGGELERDYVSRCIAEIYDEYGQEQGSAICYSTYRKSKNLSAQGKISSYLREDSYKGINLAPLEKGPNDPCWSDYVQIGTKIVDNREVPNCVPLSKEVEKIQMEKGYNFQEGEKYPWEECIADQTARYGSEEIAAKVCGYIKSKS